MRDTAEGSRISPISWGVPLVLGLAVLLAACADGGGASERTPTPTPPGASERTPTPTPPGASERTPTLTPPGASERTPTPTPPGASERTPTLTPPAEPAARFQELERLRKAATFYVVYDMDLGIPAYRAQFAWLQDGKRVRWDDSNTYKDALAGTSSIDDGAGSGLTCGWVTKTGWDKAEVSCRDVPRGFDMRILDEQLNGLSGDLGQTLDEEVEFVGFRKVLDVQVECFKATFGILVKDTRSICYSAEGLPLEVESVVGIGSREPIRLTAIEIRQPPTEAELLTPVIPDAPLGQEVKLREIPLDDLALPSLPIVEHFFSEGEQ